MSYFFIFFFFFFNDTATTDIYTLPLHDALPICRSHSRLDRAGHAFLPGPVRALLGGQAARERGAQAAGLLSENTRASFCAIRVHRRSSAAQCFFWSTGRFPESTLPRPAARGGTAWESAGNTCLHEWGRPRGQPSLQGCSTCRTPRRLWHGSVSAHCGWKLPA